MGRQRDNHKNPLGYTLLIFSIYGLLENGLAPFSNKFEKEPTF